MMVKCVQCTIALRKFLLLWLFGAAQLACSADWEILPPWAASPPWPDKVELASPDPVLGAGDIYETWAYTEAFAKRFSNLPLEQASKDMPPNLQAVVFRVYRQTLGPGWTTTVPLYYCAMDLYLDASITPEEQPMPNREVFPPEWIKTGNSLRRLKPVQEADRQSKAAQDALRVGHLPRYSSVAFLDGLLDSRYSLLGAEFRPNALPGINLLTLGATNFTTMVWPARPGQRYILSVLGNDPYQEQQILEQARKDPERTRSPGHFVQLHTVNLIRSGARYDWNPDDTIKGLFAMPDEFVERMLKKVLAVKTFNRCLEMEEHIEKNHYRKMPQEAKDNIRAGCQAMRETGQTYDAFERKFGFRDADEVRMWKLEGINKP